MKPFSVLLSALVLGACLSSTAFALDCGDRIGPGEKVVLRNGIGPCPNPLTIEGPATLDLNGHQLTCEGVGLGVGIKVVGRGARVRNGSVFACSVAVRVAGEGRHRISDLLVGSSTMGVEITSDRNKILNTDAGFSEFGFAVFGDRNTLKGNSAFDNGTGFNVFSKAERNKLIKNDVTDSHEYGIRVDGDGEPGRNVIAKNTSLGNDVADMGAIGGACGDDRWRKNDYVTFHGPCIQ